MATWQAAMCEWLTKWEWADDTLDEAHSITWIELLVCFELDTKDYLPPQVLQELWGKVNLGVQLKTDKQLYPSDRMRFV